METTEIVNRFEIPSWTLDREAIEAAVVRREEITPELLRILESTAERPDEIDSDHGYMGHFYAMYLLAQFRETRAYPLVLRIAHLPQDLLESLLGDFVTSDLDRVLASVCGGHIQGLQSLIEDETVDEWVRVSALESLVILVAAGQRGREEILTYFASLFHRGSLGKNEMLWGDLIASTCDLYPSGLIAEIERAYEQGLVDSTIIDMEDVRRYLNEGLDRTLERLATTSHYRLVDDAAEEMKWLDETEEEIERDFDEDDEGADDDFFWTEPHLPATTGPIKRTTPKIGRNEPCPCGSGKKYKKCCLV
ncbi:MAG: DUF1186 domain-containing protein [Terracidiphilus sp.]